MDSKLLDIINSIHKATVSGLLEWTLTDSCFNNDTSHRYKSKSIDGLTKFECRVDLDDLLTLSNGSITIYNKDIIDGSKFLSSGMYPISEILEWIYVNKIRPTIKTSNQDNVMDSILKGISISEYRDNKIDSILIDSPLPKEVKDVKEGFFKKIFRI